MLVRPALGQEEMQHCQNGDGVEMLLQNWPPITTLFDLHKPLALPIVQSP